MSGHKRLVSLETNKVVLVFYNHGKTNDGLNILAMNLADEYCISLPPGDYRVEDCVLCDDGVHRWRRRRSAFQVTND